MWKQSWKVVSLVTAVRYTRSVIVKKYTWRQTIDLSSNGYIFGKKSNHLRSGPFLRYPTAQRQALISTEALGISVF